MAIFAIVLLAAAGLPVFAQNSGEVAIAGQYRNWIEQEFAAGRAGHARYGLNRAQDFSAASSDLSYLLGKDQFARKEAAGAVLSSIRHALETDQWHQYTAVDARNLEVETLIQIRLYSQALENAYFLPPTADTAWLRIRALEHSDRSTFRSALFEALEQYPRDARFMRLFFEKCAQDEPELRIRILQRLPFVIESDPALAYIASPFIKDPEQASAIMAAYRAMQKRDPAHLPVALNMGLIDEKQAVDELFAAETLDISVVTSVWEGLRTEDSRTLFTQSALQFSGTFTEDADRDGFPESFTHYRNGDVQSFSYDADQDRLPEWTITFQSGVPVKGAITLADSADPFALPVSDSEQLKAVVQWERYPYLLDSTVEKTRYVPGVATFITDPVLLQELFGAFVYPVANPNTSPLTQRSLAAASLIIEMPSAEISGAIEQVELDHGIPFTSYSYRGNTLVAQTTFLSGVPVFQRIDLDGDGRLETERRFREGILDSVAVDLNGDGFFEYEERYAGETIISTWNSGN